MPDTDPIRALLGKTADLLRVRLRFPGATYRLQFNRRFTFRDARTIVPYLHELGITDCYSSPYLKAKPGSLHGYDVSDHGALNPEIGLPEDFDAWIAALREKGMGQILDVVPNHMGIADNANAWWNDVLENGPSSPFACYFDIDWYSWLKPSLRYKVLLPILGDSYGEVLEARQLVLLHDGGSFFFSYFDRRFPLELGSYKDVLCLHLASLEKELGATSEPFIEFQSILTALGHLPPYITTQLAKAGERQREKEVIKRRLGALIAGSAAIRAHVEHNVACFNGVPGDNNHLELLDSLLSKQVYRLSYWRVAADEINYRRFFDINELAALSMEKPEVFAATHERVLGWLREGKVTGLRIDHPDGLYDPRQYLERLQEHYVLACARSLAEQDPQYTGMDPLELENALRKAYLESREDPLLQRPAYVVVEKILGSHEPLPEDWPVHGTTGYEFLNTVNGLFVQSANEPAFNRLYQRFTHHIIPFPILLHQKKYLILQVALSSELLMLAHQLDRLSEKDWWSRDFTLNSLRHALRDTIAFFPVYRSYIRCGDVFSERDRHYVETAVTLARRRNPAMSKSLFDFVRDMILLRFPERAGAADRSEQCRFVGKFQQLTAPVMAKGMEDTVFYVYNRLVSLNEVGGDPQTFGASTQEFHRRNLVRQRVQPYSLSATATHDTKRGEDVRARINVLSEIPQEWRKRLFRWGRLNRRHRTSREGLHMPERNDEYLFYQTLLGTWPTETEPRPLPADFVPRLQAYMEKATREAKVHTSWINPDPGYDEAVRRFVARVLDERSNKVFLQDFRAFQRRVAYLGYFNSLSQLLLKITAPGVPDIYQGTELWDFSLVDPDNRRPVDFGSRQQFLADLQRRLGIQSPPLPVVRSLLETIEDGRVKMFVMWRALRCRREYAALFARGEYSPVEPEGLGEGHLVAFSRSWDNQQAIVCVPRFLSSLCPNKQCLPLGKGVWSETVLRLHQSGLSCDYLNIFTGETVQAFEREGKSLLLVADLLAHFPVALLLSQPAPHYHPAS
jgi:(1->4)-alpha-D-glucan 1-alpha-D-glucosylmutase